MKQRTPLKRKTPMPRGKPLRQRRREGADVEREEKPRSALPSIQPRQDVRYGGSVSGVAVVKRTAYRDAALLEMARGRHCLLRIPGMCVGATETTVAAHSNLLAHGKAKSRKADDCYSVFACYPCHFWLDQGAAAAVDKEAAFMAAHVRQVFAWREIAADASEPERFRKAARRALDRLNATPLGEAP